MLWRWRREGDRVDERLGSYRTPAQVCPRGCEYSELARRDWLAKTSLIGTAQVRTAYEFEATNCPQCGALLARSCPRCGSSVLAPVRERCQFCGLPQPWARERRGGIDRARVRFWRPGDPRAHDPATLVCKASGRGEIWVIDGEISALAVDAVVSNDDVDGRMWAQVARAIKTAAGEGVERLAQEGGPFELGHAWQTVAGDLQQMKGIIHVASMSRTGRSGIETVRASLAAALKLADKERYESVGIAAIGMAVIPSEEWFEAFADVTVSHLSNGDNEDGHSPPELAIVLVLFEPPDFEKELLAVSKAVHQAWKEQGEPDGSSPLWRPSTSRWKLFMERLSPSESPSKDRDLGAVGNQARSCVFASRRTRRR